MRTTAIMNNLLATSLQILPAYSSPRIHNEILRGHDKPLHVLMLLLNVCLARESYHKTIKL
jgi:hypothetical protein